MYLRPIDKKIIKFILERINLKCPNKRKPKYTNEYYLNKIIFILKSGCSFRDANNTFIDHHYSTIYKKYIYWTEYGIFNNLYMKLINEYKNKFLKHKHKSYILDLFIDSTNIRNKNGKDCLGRNYQDKYKNGNKITIISTKDKFPLAAKIDKANKHDSKILTDGIIRNMKNNLELNKITIVGDKGYIINDDKKKQFNRRNIKIIHPYRKNQKKKNNKMELKLLGKRYRIENFFAGLKQFKKIQLRYESKIINYEGFLKISLIVIMLRILLKESYFYDSFNPI
jgi:transposase